jgi:hypothetical protein
MKYPGKNRINLGRTRGSDVQWSGSRETLTIDRPGILLHGVRCGDNKGMLTMRLGTTIDNGNPMPICMPLYMFSGLKQLLSQRNENSESSTYTKNMMAVTIFTTNAKQKAYNPASTE